MNISTDTLSKMATWAGDHAAFFQQALDNSLDTFPSMESSWIQRRDNLLATQARWNQGILTVPSPVGVPDGFDSLIEFFDVALGELVSETLDHWDEEMPLEGLLGVWDEVMGIFGQALHAGVWVEYQAYMIEDIAKRRETGEEDDPQFLDEIELLVKDPDLFFRRALEQREGEE